MVPRDRKRGEELLREAARQLGAASFVLGKIRLREGKMEEAKELFRQGSEESRRSSDALYKFGRMTADVAIVMQAADLENARALRRMSMFYRDLEDPVMEKRLAKRAANQGRRSALRTLGEIYMREGKTQRGEQFLKRAGPRGAEHADDLF
jgi:tetratricopeptide (TPR) repeat protein